MYSSLVSVILGNKFVELLQKLPDKFFAASKYQQEAAWQRILSEINRAEGDPDLDQLARQAIL